MASCLHRWRERCATPGLKRINISIDTLDPARFERLTRRPGLEQVIEGILAAKEAGFDPVKLNAVAIRGETEDDVVPLARFAREHGLETAVHRVHAARRRPSVGARKSLFAADIIELIAQGIGPLVPGERPGPRAPALDYEYADGGGQSRASSPRSAARSA